MVGLSISSRRSLKYSFSSFFFSAFASCSSNFSREHRDQINTPCRTQISRRGEERQTHTISKLEQRNFLPGGATKNSLSTTHLLQTSLCQSTTAHKLLLILTLPTLKLPTLNLNTPKINTPKIHIRNLRCTNNLHRSTNLRR
jgi:hypothetical protein